MIPVNTFFHLSLFIFTLHGIHRHLYGDLNGASERAFPSLGYLAE